MKFKKINNSISSLYRCNLSEKEVFVHFHNRNVMRLSDAKIIAENITLSFITEDKKYLINSNFSNESSLCLELARDSTFHEKLDFYIENYNEYLKVFIARIPTTKSGKRELGIYHIADQTLQPLRNITRDFNTKYKTYCFGKYLLIDFSVRRIDLTVDLVFYDLEKQLVVAEFKDAFVQLQASGLLNDGALKFIAVVDDVLYIAQAPSIKLMQSARLFALNIPKNTIELLIKFEDDLKWNTHLAENGITASFSAGARGLQYEEETKQLISLVGYQVVQYDISSGATNIISHKKAFLEKNIFANNGGFLYKDHFYFSSRYNSKDNDGKRYTNGAVGAFNWKTHKIDWHHHLDVKGPRASLHPPKANNKYIVARGQGNRNLQIFEKIV